MPSFRYRIDYEHTDPDKKFQVDSRSGEVTLKNELDREVEERHEVHVLAVDRGILLYMMICLTMLLSGEQYFI